MKFISGLGNVQPPVQSYCQYLVPVGWLQGSCSSDSSVRHVTSVLTVGEILVEFNDMNKQECTCTYMLQTEFCFVHLERI